MKSPFLEAGRIVGTHGVRGELRVEPWCDSARFLTGFSEFYWDGGREKVKVVSSRPHKNLLLLKLEGVDTVEAGDALRGRVLYLARADAKLPQGRFFVQDLLGLSAVDADTVGNVIGMASSAEAEDTPRAYFNVALDAVAVIVNPDKNDMPLMSDRIRRTNTARLRKA